MSSLQLCELCNGLAVEETLRELFVKLNDHESADIGGQEESAEKPWHPNLPTVLKSSESCILCKIILQGLREGRRQLVEDNRFSGEWEEAPKDFDDDILTIPYYSDSTPTINIVTSTVSTFENENTLSSMEDTGGRLRAHAVIRITCGEGIESSWDGYGEIDCELRISSKNGNVDYERRDKVFINVKLGKFSMGVEIDCIIREDPTSTEVFDQLRFWTSVCSTRHKTCARYLSLVDTLPTRVINMGTSNSDLVYLEECDKSSQADRRYAALSHCWGLSQPFVTTTETLEERKQGISLNDLPLTYQDAIKVCRELGLQYIWIDSLCIIQNDSQDWAREAASMASVYRDANIVIGASNSSADSEGFLHKRTTESVSFGDNIQASLMPVEAQRLSSTSEPVKAEPLSSRAWTLQERYLPRRMISYGRGKTFWECSEMVASEDGECVRRDGDRLQLVTKTAGIEKSICDISGRSPGETDDINYFDWYETVKEYSRRHITKSTDRLPALAGLAKAVFEASNDEYLAGIWKKGLIEGLLWCRAQEDHLLTNEDYRAPSWSWASVDGPINFLVYNFYDRCSWKNMMANFELTATYVDSFLEPTAEDRYGGIKSGWMKLKAPLFPITSVKKWERVAYSPPEIMQEPLRSSACDNVFQTEIQHRGKSQKVWLDGGYDTNKSFNSEAKLFALFLARLPDPDGTLGFYLDIRFGLILEASTTKDEFKRVGIIDGAVKVHKFNLASKLQGKLYLEPLIHEAEVREEDEDIPNLMGPDPYKELEHKIVKIV